MTARCPACGAAVADGAPWCTLCYTDLRAPAVAPAGDPEPVTLPSQPPVGLEPAAAGPLASSTAPAASLDLLDPLLDTPVVAAAQAASGPATWPCQACGASVAIEHDACTQCGTAFLAGANPAIRLDLPLIGPIKPTKSSRVWLAIGGGLAVCVVVTVLLTIVGLFL